MPKDNEVDEKVNGAFSTNRDEISSKLTSLIDRYWELAYAEGQEGRTHDTDNGDAQECRYEIEKAIKSLSDHAATVAELRAEVERLRKSNELYSFAMNTAGIDELKRRADAAERRVGELEKLMAAARRAIGDHHAPNDCYATGPLTGDEFLDLVQCPACAFLEQHEALTGADPT